MKKTNLFSLRFALAVYERIEITGSNHHENVSKFMMYTALRIIG